MDGVAKVCSKCGEWKPLDSFHRASGARDGHRPDCKQCVNARHKAWYEANRRQAIERVVAWQRANPDRVAATQAAFRESGKKRLSDRKSHLKRKYGLTIDQYEELLAAQGGGCAICGRAPRDDVSLHVDHCHATDEVRGILCFRCNNALGDFGHDASLLQAAADYLAAAERVQVRRRVDAELIRPS